MGLTFSSTQKGTLKEENNFDVKDTDILVALGGNPNVGKSTVFNALTGLKQHTGNWPGKTVANAGGRYKFRNKDFFIVDLPGTYSLLSDSYEEEIAGNYLCFANPDVTVIVVDATCIERNLNLVLQVLEINSNVIVCVNLIDEAKKKGITVDIKKLSEILKVPVIATSAINKSGLDALKKAVLKSSEKPVCDTYKTKYTDIIENAVSSLEEALGDIKSKRFIALKLLDGDKNIINSISSHIGYDILDNEKITRVLSNEWETLENAGIKKNEFVREIVKTIIEDAEKISKKVVQYKKENYNERDRKIDRFITSKAFGIPIMLVFMMVILYITIKGANYPSNLLNKMFLYFEQYIVKFLSFLNVPGLIKSILVDGMYRTLSWVVSVMLPPMAIFFPLFTLLEDLGYLPRIAFNLDSVFKKACAHGKQCLTMCMGLGCNAAGVIGARIINSPRERLIAIITNSFMPCNGRFPMLIALSTMLSSVLFSGRYISIFSSFCVLFSIIIAVVVTLIASKILSKTFLKGETSHFVLELPPYRKPKILDTLYRSMFDRTLFVLSRAIVVAAPAGVIIWIFANVTIGGTSFLMHCARFLQPLASLMGIDGIILIAFILGMPANEIVIPIMLMCYLSTTTLTQSPDTFKMANILIENGWTYKTIICTMLFSLFHFPCTTTTLTIYKETKSVKWTFLSFALPLVCGIVLCMMVNLIFYIF